MWLDSYSPAGSCRKEKVRDIFNKEMSRVMQFGAEQGSCESAAGTKSGKRKVVGSTQCKLLLLW